MDGSRDQYKGDGCCDPDGPAVDSWDEGVVIAQLREKIMGNVREIVSRVCKDE